MSMRSAAIARDLRAVWCEVKPPGTQLPSERDLAGHYGVSVPTLREAMSLLAHQGWIERRQGHGTFVRQPEEKGWVGILIEADMALQGVSRNFLTVALELQRRLRAVGKRSRIYFGTRRSGEASVGLQCPDFLEDLPRENFSVVVAVVATVSGDWVEPLRERGIPIIGPNGLYDSQVGFSREGWVFEEVSRLRAEGVSRIGLVYWGGARLNPGELSYEQIFSSALRACGLRLEPSLTRCDLHPSLEGEGWKDFRHQWLHLPNGRPEAILVTDDMLLEGCLKAAREEGLRLPQDIIFSGVTCDRFRPYGYEEVHRYEWRITELVERLMQALSQPNPPPALEVPLHYVMAGTRQEEPGALEVGSFQNT